MIARATSPPVGECVGSAETAHLLNVDPSTLWRWHTLNIGPPRHYFGRKPYYVRSEVLEFRRQRARHGHAG